MDLSIRQSIPFCLKIPHALWDPCHKAPLTQGTHATLIQKTIATKELCHAQGCTEPLAQGTSSHKGPPETDPKGMAMQAQHTLEPIPKCIPWGHQSN